MSGLDDSDIKPFRIPRKSEKKPLGRRETGVEVRSSVVNAPAKGREDYQCYGRRIVPIKRKATSSTETSEKKNREGNSVSPVGHTLQSTAVPSTKKRVSKEGNSETDSTKAPQKLRRPADCVLTKEKLERHSSLQDFYSFGSKGLMEALLEHKMKTGRIDSHQEIGQSLSYRPSFQPDNQLHAAEELSSSSSSSSSPPRKGPRTPPGTPPSPGGKKGPATPPESPPPDSSSTSRSPSFRGRSSDSTTTRSTGHQEKPTTGNTGDILQEIATMARVDVSHLKNCLSAEVFNTLRQLDSTVLLATVSTVLNTIAQSMGKGSCVGGKSEGNPEVTSSSLSPKGTQKLQSEQERPVPAPADAMVSSTGLKDESVEMDLESDNGDNNNEIKLSTKIQDEMVKRDIKAEGGSVPFARVDVAGKPILGPVSNEQAFLPTQRPQTLPPLPQVQVGGVPAAPPVVPPPPPTSAFLGLPLPSPEKAVTVPICLAPTAPPPQVPPPIGMNTANPNQVQIIQTLLHALAIPKAGFGGNIVSQNVPSGPPPPNLHRPELPFPNCPPMTAVSSGPSFTPPMSRTEAFMAQIRPEIRCQEPSSVGVELRPPIPVQERFEFTSQGLRGPFMPNQVSPSAVAVPRLPPPGLPTPPIHISDREMNVVGDLTMPPFSGFNDCFARPAPSTPVFPCRPDVVQSFRRPPPVRFPVRSEERLPFRPRFGRGGSRRPPPRFYRGNFRHKFGRRAAGN